MNEITPNTPPTESTESTPSSVDTHDTAPATDEQPTEVLDDTSATAPVPPPAPAPNPLPSQPGSGTPGYDQPGYAMPGYDQSGHAAPGYGQADYGTAGYGTAGYGTAGYGGTGYAQTGYAQPQYGQPGYAQTAYAQPGSIPPGPATTAYPAPTSRRLLRSRSDRWLSGVCGGLARYWNTDPALVRILAVVLTIVTGGALLIGYVIAWIAIPEEPMGPTGYPGAPTAGYAAGTGAGQYGADPTAAQYYAEPAPRERSYLGWLVVSGAVLLLGVLGLINVLAPTSITMWGVTGGVVLTLLGVGLLVGTWYGRARWLTILAIPLAFMTFATITADRWIQDNPNWDRWTVEKSDGQLTFGDRVWAVRPADAADATTPLDYRLSAGNAVLDLTALTAGRDDVDASAAAINASVGVGQLKVIIPEDMQLNLTATVDLGEIAIPGQQVQSGRSLEIDTTVPPVGSDPAYTITLDAAIGAGSLEVLREAA